ncbi:MAG: Hpt domain-containing protein [Planctomycetota bacterium]
MEKSKKEDLTEKIESVASQVDELAKPGSDRNPQGARSPQEVGAGEEVINWNQLINLLGDVELVKEVVPVYLNDNKERFDELEEAVKLGDTATIKLYAHGIKGAGRNVGARRLSDIADQMECAGRENDVESARLLFDELRIEYEKVMSVMSDVNWTEVAERQTNTAGGE